MLCCIKEQILNVDLLVIATLVFYVDPSVSCFIAYCQADTAKKIHLVLQAAYC